jgi:tRNA(Arg) A34 adenosine deaminase TadA/predicted GNAT family acetyltransferase
MNAIENVDHSWMKRCFELARLAEANGESPVGSLLVREGKLLVEATESSRAKSDLTAHAETETIRLALRQGNTSLTDCALYTSREPCLLCAYVIRHHRIRRVVYAELGGETGSIHGVYPLLLTPQIQTWGPPPQVEQYNLVEILDYEPAHQPIFRALNEAWITEYFKLDPVDVAVLSNPEEYILKGGGRLFMARFNGRLVGTCGLLKTGNGVFEFTKMAVQKDYRGQGLGKMLALHAIAEARRLGAQQLELYTQKVLPEAIGLYRKMGFREIPLPHYKYSRADTYMVLDL